MQLQYVKNIYVVGKGDLGVLASVNYWKISNYFLTELNAFNVLVQI